MKYLLIITINLFLLSNELKAQTNMNVGGGYYGQTATHSGFVLEFGLEQVHSEKVTTPFRVDFGFFHHPRNHNGLFADANYGFRYKFKSGLYLEESLGAGILMSFLNSDGIYEVDDNGNVSEGSRFSTLDFMPSITLGLGYYIDKNGENKNHFWFRPKLYWQYPHKTTSTYNFVLQLGFTHKLSKKRND